MVIGDSFDALLEHEVLLFGKGVGIFEERNGVGKENAFGGEVNGAGLCFACGVEGLMEGFALSFESLDQLIEDTTWHRLRLLRDGGELGV